LIEEQYFPIAKKFSNCENQVWSRALSTRYVSPLFPAIKPDTSAYRPIGKLVESQVGRLSHWSVLSSARRRRSRCSRYSA